MIALTITYSKSNWLDYADDYAPTEHILKVTS